jgi:hypothetical protein
MFFYSTFVADTLRLETRTFDQLALVVPDPARELRPARDQRIVRQVDLSHTALRRGALASAAGDESPADQRLKYTLELSRWVAAAPELFEGALSTRVRAPFAGLDQVEQDPFCYRAVSGPGQ